MEIALEKLFGGKTKCDILKYLVFKRQGVSIRSLDKELDETFPAIKKQIDQLETAHIVNIDKNNAGWSIVLDPDYQQYIRGIFLTSLAKELDVIQKDIYTNIVTQIYYGNIWGYDVEVDLILLHDRVDPATLSQLKIDIDMILSKYMVDHISIVFMSQDEFDRRVRMADKFALSIIRAISSPKKP